MNQQFTADNQACAFSLRVRLSQKRNYWLFLLLFTIAWTVAMPADAQMTTSGSFDVDQSGVASFGIPITVPPGTGGIVPTVSLNYYSQGGNGLLGIGWSLDGLSLISRCTRTIPQDGVRGGVKFNSGDRFCLDGSRLMRWGGTYGQDGATYRTELDAISKITSVGTSGSGPAYFTVKTKSGLTYEYGNTEESKIKLSGTETVRVWALNKISDTVGNYLTVTYERDLINGEYRPSRIDYTGNSITEQAPYASVRFSYEVRPDKVSGFSLGSSGQISRRLTNVKTYYGGNLVFDYRLGYEQSPATGGSRIKTIEQCSADGICLPPVSMTWTGSAPQSTTLAANWTGWSPGTPADVFMEFSDVTGDGLLDSVKYNPATGQITTYVNAGGLHFDNPREGTIQWNGAVLTGSVASRLFQPMDVDGDLKSDILIYDPEGGYIYVALSNGDGTYRPAVRSQFKTASIGNGLPIKFAAMLTAGSQAFFLDFGDYNNDSVPDVSLMIPGDGAEGCGTTSNGATWLAFGVGDGTFGAASDSLNFSICNYLTIRGNIKFGRYKTLSAVSDVLFNDYDSDGVTDWTVFYTSRVGPDPDLEPYPYRSYCYFSAINATSNGARNPDSFLDLDSQYYGSSGEGENIGAGGYICPPDPVASGVRKVVYTAPGMDLNADGNADFVIFSDAGGSPALAGFGRGDGTYEEKSVGLALSVYEDGADGELRPFTSFGDYNGDGLSDFFGKVSGSDARALFLGRWDGQFNVLETSTNTWFGKDWDRWLDAVDLDGDGVAEIFKYIPGLDGSVWIWKQQGGIPDRIVQFEDGLGGQVKVTYGSLTDAGVYTKGGPAVDGAVDVQIPIPVVTQVMTSDGIGGFRTTKYTYGGLKVDRGGRGSLGFAWIEEQQVETDALTRTEYLQAWPYTGMARFKTVSVPQRPGLPRQLIQQITNTYACLHPVNNGVACAVASGKTYFPYLSQSEEKAWELDDGHTPVPTVTTATTYDKYGNATKVIVTTSDGYSKTTDNIYTNNETDWLLGRLTSTTVKSVAPDVVH